MNEELSRVNAKGQACITAYLDTLAKLSNSQLKSDALQVQPQEQLAEWDESHKKLLKSAQSFKKEFLARMTSFRKELLERIKSNKKKHLKKRN